MSVRRSWAALVALAGLMCAGPAVGQDKKTDDKKEEKKEPASLIGKPAPAFVGKFALNGKNLSLADYKGKVVLIDFWAVWCGPCIRAFPALSALQEEFKGKDFNVLGVTYYQEIYGFDKEAGKLSVIGKRVKGEDGKIIVKDGISAEKEHEMLKDFAGFHKLKYPLLALSTPDWRKTVNTEYFVRGIPTLVLVDRLGVVRHVQVGYNPRLEEQLGDHVRKLLAEK